MSIAEVIDALVDAREAGGDLVLASVLETWGSAPRPAGSCLLVGYGETPGVPRLAGSVSGGCVEAAVVELGREVLASGRPRVVDYGVAEADARALGLSCGGRLQVLVLPVDPADPVWTQLASRLAAGETLHLLLDLEDGRPFLVEIDHEGRPRPAAGGAWPPDRSTAIAAALTGTPLPDRPRILRAAGRDWVLLPQRPADRLFLVGAGHIAQHLAALAGRLDFPVTVVDPRAAFAAPERFPGLAAPVQAWPELDRLQALGLGPASYLVALAHDPKIDDPGLAAALAAGARYVGALGSRRSHAARVERLRERGLDPTEIARIHAPVGLAIGARTPAEIALAVLAEMVAVRRAAATDSG